MVHSPLHPFYPHLQWWAVRLRQVAGKSSSFTTSKPATACVHCLIHSGVSWCELMHTRLWHVTDYTVHAGFTGLFLPSRVSDLPAVIMFHLGWTAQRTRTNHFSLGLYWRLIPAVLLHFQYCGYIKTSKSNCSRSKGTFLLAFENRVNKKASSTFNICGFLTKHTTLIINSSHYVNK